MAWVAPSTSRSIATMMVSARAGPASVAAGPMAARVSPTVWLAAGGTGTAAGPAATAAIVPATRTMNAAISRRAAISLNGTSTPLGSPAATRTPATAATAAASAARRITSTAGANTATFPVAAIARLWEPTAAYTIAAATLIGALALLVTKTWSAMYWSMLLALAAGWSSAWSP